MIEHHPDCVSWDDNDFCDCDFHERLEKEAIEAFSPDVVLRALYVLSLDPSQPYVLNLDLKPIDFKNYRNSLAVEAQEYYEQMLLERAKSIQALRNIGAKIWIELNLDLEETDLDLLKTANLESRVLVEILEIVQETLSNSERKYPPLGGKS
jgi:hypothetical protein